MDMIGIERPVQKAVKQGIEMGKRVWCSLKWGN